jgi:hypothetical protein
MEIVSLLMLGNLQQSPKGGRQEFIKYVMCISNMKVIIYKSFLVKIWQHGQSRGLGCRLWLSATLSRAKASIGPSPMARLGPA